MVYRDTRIVSFYIAIYQYTGNIAHPYWNIINSSKVKLLNITWYRLKPVSKMYKYPIKSLKYDSVT